jgi:hypothetical protein
MERASLTTHQTVSIGPQESQRKKPAKENHGKVITPIIATVSSLIPASPPYPPPKMRPSNTLSEVSPFYPPTNSDPGVVPLTLPEPPAKDKHHLENMTRAALVGPSSAASPQGHLRTQSDPIVYTNTKKVEVEERRSEGGLVRKKAQIYARVPLIMMLSPEPCCLPPPAQRTVVSSLEGSSAVVSMEKIKPNGTCSRTIVKYDRVFVDKPIPPLPICSGSGEMTSDVVREERTEEIFPKMVCGLPCLSKEREEELKYTLEILSGVGVRRVEEIGPRFKEKEV